MARILVVDDEPDLEALVLQRFRRQIRGGAYDFLFASDGNDALAKLEANPDVELVLTDINMPGMDGLTLLGHLERFGTRLKAVIVSAYGDMQNIRTAMNRGAFDFVTKPVDFQDLERTVDKTLRELALMREAIEQRRRAERARANLARYFPPSMVDTLVEMDDPFGRPREHEVAVLFADIVEFMQLCREETPEVIFALLREFLGRIAEDVLRQGGTLDKFMGDGLMATFGTPLAGPHDATSAFRCALAMRSEVARFNAIRAADGKPPVNLAVGVHYGPVLMGNIGGTARMEFAVIGETVNIANRVENLARRLDTDLVFSDDLVARLRAESPEDLPELADLIDRGPQDLKGRLAPMRVWTLPSARPAG